MPILLIQPQEGWCCTFSDDGGRKIEWPSSPLREPVVRLQVDVPGGSVRLRVDGRDFGTVYQRHGLAPVPLPLQASILAFGTGPMMQLLDGEVW